MNATHLIEGAKLSAELVRWMRVADLAYDNFGGSHFAQLADDLGLKIVGTVVDDRTSTQVFFAELMDDDAPPTLVVAWRGSQDWRDAMTDIAINWKPCGYLPGGPWVHCGFLTAYNAVAAKGRSIVAAYFDAHPKAGIMSVGHSLGGALATHAALELSLLWPDRRIAARTFGSPRVGLAPFVATYDARVPDTIRVVHAEDVVPKIPFGWYRHVGGLLHVNHDGTVKSPVTNWFRRILGLGTSLWADVDGAGEQDHMELSYVDALQRMTR